MDTLAIDARTVSVLKMLACVTMLAAGCTIVGPSAQCRSNEDPAIVESLYFGTAMPSGRVSTEDWQRFLTETITPRFPEGLTSWAAAGQWRNAKGELQKEDAYVLHVVHKDERRYDDAVREIVATYKDRFQQEAVLRMRTASCMSF